MTFSEHTGPVTGLAFTQSGKAILSSSLDGKYYRLFNFMSVNLCMEFFPIGLKLAGDMSFLPVLFYFSVY